MLIYLLKVTGHTRAISLAFALTVLLSSFATCQGAQAEPPNEALPKETPKDAQTESSATKQGAPITLYAVGDIMLTRGVAREMREQKNDDPFKMVSPILKTGDIVFANLESILGDESDKLKFKDKPYNFRAPLSSALVLKSAGFNVLTLANNHALDYGAKAITKTREELAKNNIKSFGAGKNLAEAREPAIIDVKGVKFAFLGYAIAHSDAVYATDKSAGVAPFKAAMIKKDIKAIRPKADVVVVSLHWGVEYKSIPGKAQVKLAHDIVEWGGDVILGHHPHVLQGIEEYKGKVIAYSLGNFIFDQRSPGTDRSILLICKFKGRNLESFDFIPLDRYGRVFPKPAEDKIRTEMLAEMKKISDPLKEKQKVAGKPAKKTKGAADAPKKTI